MGDMLRRAFRTQECGSALLGLTASTEIMQMRINLLERKFKRSGKTPAQLLGRHLNEWLNDPSPLKYQQILKSIGINY